MLSLPTHEAQLEIMIRRKTRFGSRAYGHATVNLADLPLRGLEGEQRHEIVVPIKVGASLTLQMSLMCLE